MLKTHHFYNFSRKIYPKSAGECCQVQGTLGLSTDSLSMQNLGSYENHPRSYYQPFSVVYNLAAYLIVNGPISLKGRILSVQKCTHTNDVGSKFGSVKNVEFI